MLQKSLQQDRQTEEKHDQGTVQASWSTARRWSSPTDHERRERLLGLPTNSQQEYEAGGVEQQASWSEQQAGGDEAPNQGAMGQPAESVYYYEPTEALLTLFPNIRQYLNEFESTQQQLTSLL
jgi:hypothetical protein